MEEIRADMEVSFVSSIIYKGGFYMGATMTLEDLLPTLSKNDMLSITLVDSNEEKLITFNAGGYANVESNLFNSFLSSFWSL